MKICAAQIKPIKGDIQKNIVAHKNLIHLAAQHGTDLICFPELSLTGYEPALAKELAADKIDKRLDEFQEISNAKNISTCVGLPIKNHAGIFISMMIFQPNKASLIYSKQHLHEDEFPYFINGEKQVYLNTKNKKIAPAICYESLLPQHSKTAFDNGANIYLASVAKAKKGIEKAFKHFPVIAKKYSLSVVMSNCIGPCDNFESAGNSSVWDDKGKLIGQLDSQSEGILIYDTETNEVIKERV